MTRSEIYAPLASLHGYTNASEQSSVRRLQLPVLRETLPRGDLDRAKRTDPRERVGTSHSAVRAFIHTVRHFPTPHSASGRVCRPRRCV